MKKICLERGCPRLINGGSRCLQHTRARQRQRDAIRGTASQRGYDRTYRALRRAVLATGDPCHWCGGMATTADHLVPLSWGGANDIDNLVPSCGPCNYSRGGRMARR